VGARLRLVSDLKAQPGLRVWVALRPEHLRITTPAVAEGENVLTGNVSDIAYLGDISVYKVRLLSGGEVKVSVVNQSRRIGEAIRSDDPVSLSFAPGAGAILTR
jgi:putrescine transport system ATP-binding protein